MRFALLGDHPDGLDMARALTDSGRHELPVYSGPPLGLDYLRRWNIDPNPVGDRRPTRRPDRAAGGITPAA